MITENFHWWLCVRVITWLEFDLWHSHFCEECSNNCHEVSKVEILVNDKSFNLVEFTKMSGIKGFISENFIDWEALEWCEFFVFDAFLSVFIQYLRWNSSCVCSQDVFSSFTNLPDVVMSNGLESTSLVHLFDLL